MSSKKEQGGLQERLNPAILKALQGKKEELKKVETDNAEQLRQQRIKERKKREANKSFEELLGESDLNWKKFK